MRTIVILILSLALLALARNTREDNGFGTKWSYSDFGADVKGFFLLFFLFYCFLFVWRQILV